MKSPMAALNLAFPGWTNLAGASAVTDATKSHSGSGYVQLSAAASSGAFAMLTNYVPVTPGEVVAFGGWAYHESGTGGGTGWFLQASDSSHTAIEWAGPSPSNVTASSWTDQVGSFTVPSGVAYVQVYCQIYLPTTATVARCDDGFLSAGTQYIHFDHLAPRVITDTSGADIGEQGHYPYGESWYANNATTKWAFTSYEHDSESLNEYAMARYDASRLGRFLSPDPAGKAAVDFTNPQSINQYVYVLNNPLNLTDPTGMYACVVNCYIAGGMDSSAWMGGALTNGNSDEFERFDIGSRPGDNEPDALQTLIHANTGFYSWGDWTNYLTSAAAAYDEGPGAKMNVALAIQKLEKERGNERAIHW